MTNPTSDGYPYEGVDISGVLELGSEKAKIYRVRELNVGRVGKGRNL